MPVRVSPVGPLASRGAQPRGRQASTAFLLAPLLIVGSVVGGCAAGRSTGPEGVGARDKVEAGVWGGEHAGLTVTGEGAAVEFDCGHGAIGERLLLDGGNRFDLEGTFVLEQGGPVRPGQILPTSRARYTASIEGRKMKLTVTLIGSDERIGEFDLVLGESPRLFKCL